ncbi:hypothetical protein BDV11DRAFT_175054 [Aspergillus similis]
MSGYTSYFDEAMDKLLYNSPLPHTMTPLEELPELYLPTFSGSKTPMLQGGMDLELNAGSTSFSEAGLEPRIIDPKVLTLKEECYLTQDCDIAVDLEITPGQLLSLSDCPLLDNPNSPDPVEESSSCHDFSDDNAEDPDTEYLLIILSEQEFLKGELKVLKEENMNLVKLLEDASEDGRTSKVARGGKAERQVKAGRVTKPAKGGAPALPRQSGRKREVTMASGNWISHIGPFEVLKWPTEAYMMGIARHQITQERAYIKREWYRPLAHEALTLQAAAGGVGIPALHWLQTIGGKDVALVLLGFGHQILSRVEFLHSRGIVHGNLSPWLFALGLGWQNQQLLLVDLNTNNHGKTALDDLSAVCHIVGYLYSGAESWADYQLGDLPPFLSTFGCMLSRSKPSSIDYQSLQDVFLDAHHDLAVNLAVALDLEGPRAVKDGLSPNMGALTMLTTKELFDSLSIALPKAGELIDCRSASAAIVLECFEDIMDIYLVLVVRDRPSSLRQHHLIGAYYLPNRLWRDIRWFLNKVKGDDLRIALYAQAYRFITALFNIKQSYREYWAGYLLHLARARKNLEADYGKAAWIQTVSYWQGVVNNFNAEVESVTRSR